MSGASARLEGFQTDFEENPLRTFTRTAAFGASAALALAALTGCAGGAQSVADACTIVEDGVMDLQSESEAMNEAVQADDIDAVSASYSDLSDRFDEIAGEVTNDEVKPLVDEMAEGISTFSDLLGEAESFTDVAASQEFGDTATRMAEVGTELGELCEF